MVLKRNLLTLAVASILASSLAHAQTAPAQPGATGSAEQEAPKKPGDTKTDEEKAAELGEIKVTGVRAAIERAISVKQNSNEIVEAISAEDIGKLPDNSIAESLARLPGIAAQRVAGRASTLSLRGFSGDFSGTLLNGREQVSTGDNRAIEFDQYPSELLSGAVVYKTPEASLVGQGIAGTIAMQSARPLDYDKRVVQLGARGETVSYSSFNEGTDTKGYRVNAAYIDQFMDHTLGVAIGVARLKSPTQDERYRPYGYPDITVPVGTPGMASGGSVKGLGGAELDAESVEGTRDAMLGTVEWRPNDRFTSTLDLYYSKFDQLTHFNQFQVGLGPWGCCGGSLANAVVSNGLLVNSTWQVKPVLREELDSHNDDIKSIGWNNKFRFGEAWELNTDLSYAKAHSKQSILEMYAGTVPGSPGAFDTWNVGLTPGDPLAHFSGIGINYGDPNIIKLTDSGGWGQDGYLKFPKTSDELKAVRVDLAREINGPISKIVGGINYNERTKTRDSAEFFIFLPGDTRGHTGHSATVPSACANGTSYFGFVGFPNVLNYDPQCVLNNGTEQLQQWSHQDILNKDWKVQEKVGTAYLMANLDTEIANMPLRGNFGAQYVHANQSSDALAVTNTDGGTITSNSVVTPVHDGANYGNFLPSLNLVLTMPSENYLRFGAGREIARPRLDYMRANTEYGINLTPNNNFNVTTCKNATTGASTVCRIEGSGGNPELKPFLADAYDLSWEKYWETKAYVSATLFYKSLKTYVYNQNITHDFTGVPLSSFGNLTPASLIGQLYTPQNGTGGYMRGYELSASMPLEVLWAPLEGFGVQAWYASTKSSINPNGPGTDSSPFPGLSKYASGLTAYYEKAGFSARIAATHRSDYLGEVQAFGADRSFTVIHAETVTDFQLGYSIQNGKYEGLSFLLQVQNMFNEPYREFTNTPLTSGIYDLYGRRYLLGVNYKF